jgi:hypothetical protein
MDISPTYTYEDVIDLLKTADLNQVHYILSITWKEKELYTVSQSTYILTAISEKLRQLSREWKLVYSIQRRNSYFLPESLTAISLQELNESWKEKI